MRHNSSAKSSPRRERETSPCCKKVLKKYGWKLIVFWGSDLKREDAEQFVLSELKKHKVVSL